MGICVKAELRGLETAGPDGQGGRLGSWGSLWEGSPRLWMSHGFGARLSVFLPQVPPQPFLEMEQLRLARQLEGLRARLGLGTREDVTPKSGSEAQGEGRD